MVSPSAPTGQHAAPTPEAPSRPGDARRRTAVVLAALLVPAALATLVGLVLLWPSGDRPATGVVALDAEYPRAEVVSSAEGACAASSEDRLPDGTIPDEVRCTTVVATVVEGDAAGTEVEVWALPTLTAADLPPGTAVVLERYLATDTEPEVWVFHDVARTAPLGVLAAAFAVVVVAVAGLRGLRAIIGLAIAFGVVAVFMLPALLEGKDPLAVGLAGSAAIMFVVLYLAHGFSLRTTTALLGTFAGLGATAGLGVLAANAARLNGVTSEDEYRLAQLTGQLDGSQLRGLFLCGVVLAGLGVLNDVTITQASAVWELRAVDAEATRGSLFRGGMRIGRDHIASTVYTIAFAYAGAALPVLLLLEVYQLPWSLTIGGGEFAQEIARTLVGSIGLVLAIPLTTAIAAVVVTRLPVRQVRREGAGHGHPHAPVA